MSIVGNARCVIDFSRLPRLDSKIKVYILALFIYFNCVNDGWMVWMDILETQLGL